MDTEKLTTDELFAALPGFINVKGDFYHFNLIKGKRILISYQTNPSEGGKYLCSTYRTGKTLKEALKSMLDWLIESKYYNLKSENILIDMLKHADILNKSK